jgi:Tudor domain
LNLITVHIGFCFEGIISHIKSDEKNFFVVVNNDLKIFKNMKIDVQSLILHFWYPMIGDRFLMNTANFGILRAERQVVDENVDQTVPCFQILLIDSGETFILDIHVIPYDAFYALPDELKEIPPMAKKCKLSDCHNMDQLELYAIQNFKIINQIEDEWIVEIIKDDKEPRISSKLFNEAEIEMLFEDPLNTDNALIAVRGYDDCKDDYLCKFYDSKTGFSKIFKFFI